MRAATEADAAGLIALWQAAGLGFDPRAVPAELAGVLARTPQLVLVEEDEAGAIAGAVLGTYDGRRGRVSRLAVRPDLQGRGLGSRLLAELERRLAELGCPKVNLTVEADNAEVTGFYERHGYRRHDLIFLEKWLPTSTRRDLKPELSAEPYVFASVTGPAPGVPMFAAILEDEGLTLVLTMADADRVGLAYTYVAARITLRVDSTLDEVGLTAAFGTVLAEAGISCNVIAGVAHDHLFVPWEHGEQAAELLRAR
ncbi:MAG TPA: ACT domain-containing protein [Streptosporangiaceae bacterium]|nr:ACT domain-containing protein [Streptosporangiaceae bacterium]